MVGYIYPLGKWVIVRFKEEKLMVFLPIWLAGDPFVGILTTIGFFSFVIVGRAVKLRKIKHKSNS